MADQVFRADSPAPQMRWVSERLLAILDTAVSLQPETESVLRSCADRRAVDRTGVDRTAVDRRVNDAVLARQAGRLTSALLHLVDRANALPGSLVVDEARALLRYHHRLLTETLEHASGPESALGRSDTAHLLPDCTGTDLPDGLPERSGCLGEPAARLRRLRTVVAAHLGDDSPGNVSPASPGPR